MEPKPTKNHRDFSRELLETLNLTFHRVRQNTIDEELFDEISGFEAMKEVGK